MAIRSYDQHQLLQPFTCAVHEGEWITLVGRNGSGKSTLGRIISGLQRSGLEITGQEMRQSADIFPIVTQMTSDYLLGASAYEDLVISYEQYGRRVEPEQLEARIDELLAALQLRELKHVPIDQLSGGERQLVAFTGALLMETRCIILDEITSMLSETNKWRVCEMIRKLAAEQGIAVIWITQQLDELEASDTVWVMSELEMVYQGSAAELYRYCGEEAGSKAAQLGLPTPWSVHKSYELGLAAEQLQFNPYSLAKVVKQHAVAAY